MPNLVALGQTIWAQVGKAHKIFKALGPIPWDGTLFITLETCPSPRYTRDTRLIKVGQYYRPTVLGEKNCSCVIEKLVIFSWPTKVGQQKIFSNMFENTTTYRRKSRAAIGSIFCLKYTGRGMMQ